MRFLLPGTWADLEAAFISGEQLGVLCPLLAEPLTGVAVSTSCSLEYVLSQHPSQHYLKLCEAQATRSGHMLASAELPDDSQHNCKPRECTILDVQFG